MKIKRIIGGKPDRGNRTVSVDFETEDGNKTLDFSEEVASQLPIFGLQMLTSLNVGDPTQTFYEITPKEVRISEDRRSSDVLLLVHLADGTPYLAFEVPGGIDRLEADIVRVRKLLSLQPESPSKN